MTKVLNYDSQTITNTHNNYNTSSKQWIRENKLIWKIMNHAFEHGGQMNVNILKNN